MKPKKKYVPSMKVPDVSMIKLPNDAPIDDRVNSEKYRLKVPIHQPKKTKKK